MDYEMSNGGGFDAQARYAALDERVTNLRTSFVNLEGEMRSGFAGLNSHLTSLSNELRTSQKTQWPVIWAAAGVVFSVLVGIGGALYLPVLNNLSEQKGEIKELRSGFVPRDEIDWRATRAAEDRARLETNLTDIRSQMTPRSERDSIMRGIEQRFSDIQRQLDQLRERRSRLN